MGKSSTQKSETKVVIPPPTADEKRAQALANIVNEENLRAMGYELKPKVNGELAGLYDRMKELSDSGALANHVPGDEADQIQERIRAMGGDVNWTKGSQGAPGAEGDFELVKRQLTPEEMEEEEFNKAIQKKIRSQLLGEGPSEETRRLVGETYQAQRTAGNEELSRYLGEQAAARGLDITDTPLLREVGIQKASLETGLRGAESAALLDEGHRQQLFAAAMRDFQEGLRQQAFLNRAAVGESYSQTALGLARMRAASPTTTSKVTMPGGGFNFGQAIMGGIQGAAAGGQAGGPWGAVGGGLVGFGGGGLSGMR